MPDTDAPPPQTSPSDLEPDTVFLAEDPRYTLVGFLEHVPAVQQVRTVETREDGGLEFEFGDDDIWWDDAEESLIEDPRLVEVPAVIVHATLDFDSKEPGYRRVPVTCCSIVRDGGVVLPLLWTADKGVHIQP